MQYTIAPQVSMPAQPTPRPPLSREELRDVLTIALRAGQLMVENGANTARVEETVHRLGTALGAEWLDVYVTPGGIIATDTSHGEHRTKIQRITRNGLDLSRVAAVLELSRRVEVEQLSIGQVRGALEVIARQPRVYPRWLTVLAVGMSCASFALMFGGGLREAFATLLAAGSAQWLRDSFAHLNVSRLLMTAVIAAYAAGTALALALALGAIAPDLTMLASVLLLVPGVLMVSSVADLFRGDTLSGLARGAAALLVSSAIGAGVWTVVLVCGIQLGATLVQVPSLLLGAALAFVATAGFAVLFDVPRPALVSAALVGAFAYATRQVALFAGLPPEAAIFLGGLVVGLLAEVLARQMRMPTSIFSMPGFIPLVPGTLAFRTVLDFASADYPSGTASLVRTALLTGALAAGLGTTSALARMRQKSLF